MNFWQVLLIVAFVAIYLVSILGFIGFCISTHLKKVLHQRSLRRHSQQFPCGSCRYFSYETELRCAVRPIEVMTDAAQNCHDFEVQ